MSDQVTSPITIFIADNHSDDELVRKEIAKYRFGIVELPNDDKINAMIKDKTTKILLIEDDEDDFILMQNLLKEIEQFNFKLDWERNVKQGLEKVKKASHDIYFVDYDLGESSGMEFIKLAKMEGIEMPFILLTGKGNKAIEQQAIDLGAADFLVKADLSPEIIGRSIRYTLKHQRAFDLVKKAEIKFRQLFERSIDPIFIMNSQYNLVATNPSFESLFSNTAVLAKNFSEFFYNDTQFVDFSEQLNEKDFVRDFEAKMCYKDGMPIDCLVTCNEQANAQGVRIGYQGIIRDITLQKKAEEDLIIAEKLSMTGKLARSIAHEIRNPLTNLGLALGQLEDELDKSNDDVKMFLDIIDRNSTRIGLLITEMLNSSKPKDLRKEDRDINSVVKDTIGLIQNRLTLKNILLDTAFDQTLGLVSIDAEVFKIAMLNVMVNAIEAMEESDGRLVIHTGADETNVFITISDNGRGISGEELENLFDAFYTTKPGGTGLGLTTTQNFINSHGGRVQVESKLGVGTTFKISIPNQ